MTLLITATAALVSTVVWYVRPKSKMRLGMLCLMYWGASLMWLVDAVAEYIELGAEYFTPAASDMLNDSYLGFSVVVFGMLLWLAALLWKDPEGKVRAALKKG